MIFSAPKPTTTPIPTTTKTTKASTTIKTTILTTTPTSQMPTAKSMEPTIDATTLSVQFSPTTSQLWTGSRSKESFTTKESAKEADTSNQLALGITFLLIITLASVTIAYAYIKQNSYNLFSLPWQRYKNKDLLTTSRRPHPILDEISQITSYSSKVNISLLYGKESEADSEVRPKDQQSQRPSKQSETERPETQKSSNAKANPLTLVTGANKSSNLVTRQKRKKRRRVASSVPQQHDTLHVSAGSTQTGSPSIKPVLYQRYSLNQQSQAMQFLRYHQYQPAANHNVPSISVQHHRFPGPPSDVDYLKFFGVTERWQNALCTNSQLMSQQRQISMQSMTTMTNNSKASLHPKSSRKSVRNDRRLSGQDASVMKMQRADSRIKSKTYM